MADTAPRHVEALLDVVSLLVGGAVEPRDDFYDVGGHSLMIVQVIRRLDAEHGLVLDPRAFARSTTLDDLAAAIRPRG